MGEFPIDAVKLADVEKTYGFSFTKGYRDYITFVNVTSEQSYFLHNVLVFYMDNAPSSLTNNGILYFDRLYDLSELVTKIKQFVDILEKSVVPIGQCRTADGVMYELCLGVNGDCDAVYVWNGKPDGLYVASRSFFDFICDLEIFREESDEGATVVTCDSEYGPIDIDELFKELSAKTFT